MPYLYWNTSNRLKRGKFGMYGAQPCCVIFPISFTASGMSDWHLTGTGLIGNGGISTSGYAGNNFRRYFVK